MFKVFVSSFFIQASWSFERMQGLGFAASIAPAISRIYKDKVLACEALKRHMTFYNAHPYMAAPILGAVIKMEEDVRDGKRDAKDISSFKESLMGPYGAIGDSFFWGAVRPFASVAGVLSAFIWGIWGPVIFLILYNMFHLWMRWSGLRSGYRLGEDVVEYIRSMELPQWALRIRIVTAGLFGALVVLIILKGIYIFIGPAVPAYQIFLLTVLAIALVVALATIVRNMVSGLLLIYLLFLPACIFLIILGILKGV